MSGESQSLRHAETQGEAGKVCPLCGAPFTCGMAAGSGHCWCGDLPPLMTDPGVEGCLCPACLNRLLEKAPPGRA